MKSESNSLIVELFWKTLKTEYVGSGSKLLN
jgi:hypothetical protein